MDKQYKVVLSKWLDDADIDVEVLVEGNEDDDVPYRLKMQLETIDVWLSEKDVTQLIKILQAAKRERKLFND